MIGENSLNDENLFRDLETMSDTWKMLHPGEDWSSSPVSLFKEFRRQVALKALMERKQKKLKKRSERLDFQYK
jgi:hypothetical protein